MTTIQTVSRSLDLIAPIMAKHLPDGWTWGFDKARSSAGMARFKTKRVTFSEVLLPYMTDEQVIQTAYHEAAHAMVGAKHGHGPVWRAQMIQLGCSPDRTLKMHGQEQPPSKWIGTCPNGHTIGRDRLTEKARRVSCGKCSPRFNPEFKYRWTQHR